MVGPNAVFRAAAKQLALQNRVDEDAVRTLEEKHVLRVVAQPGRTHTHTYI